jgi:2'-5' RNA ligase
MIRVFVALPIPLDVATRLVGLVPQELEGLKPVGPELMHVTLAFVGWLDESRVPEVTAAVERAVAGARGFDVGLAGVGRFPPTGRPRVVWVGTTAGPQIEELADHVRTQLGRHGVPFDPKPVRPHVTLGRAREDASLESARAVAAAVRGAQVPPGLRLRVNAVEVMRSTLTPRGAQYSVLARVPLGRRSKGSPAVRGY